MDMMVAAAAAMVWLVFLVAGLRKLRQTDATASTLRAFGLPGNAAALLAPVLPWLELAAVALLLLPGLAWLGAGLALLLLAVFTLVMAWALLRGRRPACNCFGQAADRPISWWTAARNAVLLALAAVVAWHPEQLASGVLPLWTATLQHVGPIGLLAALLLVLVGGQTLLLTKLFDQQGRMLLRIDNLEHALSQRDGTSVTHTVLSPGSLPLGALAPDFEVMPLAGGATQPMAHWFASRRELVLVFVSPDCAPCHELLDWLLRQPLRAQAVVLTSGSPNHNKRLRKGHDGLQILIQSGQQAQDLFGIIGTPSAVRVHDGRIASPVAVGMAPIQSLFDVAAPGPAPAYMAGAPGLT